MGIAFGLFLAALGAIARYGFDENLEGIHLDTIGAILMVVGGAILLISLMFWGFEALAYEDDRHRRVRQHRHYDRDAELADAELDIVERRYPPDEEVR